LHFGDNWRVDIETAEKLGITAGYIPSCTDMLRELNPGIYSGKWFEALYNQNKSVFDYRTGLSGYLYVSAGLGLVAKKYYDNPFCSPINKESDFNADPCYIGYSLYGPHILSVADWLKDVAADKNVVHFTSRDGFVLKDVFDLISEGKKSTYLYTSRSSLASLDINKPEDFFSIYGKFQIETLSPKIVYEVMPELFVNIEKNEIVKKCKHARFIWDNSFGTLERLSEYIEFFFAELYDKQAHIRQTEIAKTYFKQNIGENDLVFDMGYGGRLEAT
jgi:hypothetical protein